MRFAGKAIHDFGNLRNAMGGTYECPLKSEAPRVVYNCGTDEETELEGVTCVDCSDE